MVNRKFMFDVLEKLCNATCPECYRDKALVYVSYDGNIWIVCEVCGFEECIGNVNDNYPKLYWRFSDYNVRWCKEKIRRLRRLFNK